MILLAHSLYLSIPSLNGSNEIGRGGKAENILRIFTNVVLALSPVDRLIAAKADGGMDGRGGGGFPFTWRFRPNPFQRALFE